jgi:hypothetical protein
MSQQSEQIDKLVEALSKAQAEMSNPVFDRKNPHFNSSYASEAAINDAVRGPLSKHGLALTHQTVDGVLITKVLHGNQWLGTEWKLNVTSGKPQERGSELTYGRRYNTCGLLGIVGDSDDDANEAMKAPIKISERAKPVPPPSKAAEALIEIGNMKGGGSAAPAEADKPFDWIDYGKKMIAVAEKGEPFTPEQQAKMSEMQAVASKVYGRMVKAIARAQENAQPHPKEPPQPAPEDDPDAYRMWLIDQMSRFDTGADLHDFHQMQIPKWEPCFPPDIEDWENLIKERAAELGK